MKSTILFLALLCGAVAQDSKCVTTSSDLYSITATTITAAAYNITFECGLSISMATGAVTIPKGLTVDAASMEFWKGVESAYPHAIGKRYLPDDAADVVKAMKLLDMEREILELTIGLFVSPEVSAEEKMKRAIAYREDRANREKRIAWARTVLAKWEERAK